jgi:hypothetical protein
MRSLLAASAALALAAPAAPAAAGLSPGPVQPPFRDEATATAARVAFARVVPGWERLLVTFSDRPSAEEAARRLRGIGVVRPLVAEAGVYRVDPARPATARAESLRRERVEAAEWSLERRSAERAVAHAGPLPLVPVADPVDPLYPSQWSLRPERLWRPLLTGSATRPAIAILDGGVDVRHEEWSGSESPLVHPYSSYRKRPAAGDWGRTGHGTHVAGVAAAPINGVGVVGVAPGRARAAPVIPVQIADRDGRSTDETMMDGIRWAVRHGARVINISAGGPGFSRAFQRTVDWAFAHGALIVASVGNEGRDANPLNYPAAYAHVLGVGAQCDGEATPPDCPRPYGVARFTNHNRSLDVIAPGVAILSSVPERVTENRVAPGYAIKDGTSMAAPYVAGVAALVFGANPEASPYQVMRQIQNTATDVGRRGRDDASGYGIVNPEAAVTQPLPADDPGEPNDDIPSLARRPSLTAARAPSVIEARVDRNDDPDDVYPVDLRAGDRIRASVDYGPGLLNLYLWRPGTRTVATTVHGNVRRNLLAFAGVPGARRQAIAVTIRRSGRHYLNVFARRGGSRYRLTVAVSPARAG